MMLFSKNITGRVNDAMIYSCTVIIIIVNLSIEKLLNTITIVSL